MENTRPEVQDALKLLQQDCFKTEPIEEVIQHRLRELEVLYSRRDSLKEKISSLPNDLALKRMQLEWDFATIEKQIQVYESCKEWENIRRMGFRAIYLNALSKSDQNGLPLFGLGDMNSGSDYFYILCKSNYFFLRMGQEASICISNEHITGITCGSCYDVGTPDIAIEEYFKIVKKNPGLYGSGRFSIEPWIVKATYTSFDYLIPSAVKQKVLISEELFKEFGCYQGTYVIYDSKGRWNVDYFLLTLDGYISIPGKPNNPEPTDAVVIIMACGLPWLVENFTATPLSVY